MKYPKTKSKIVREEPDEVSMDEYAGIKENYTPGLGALDFIRSALGDHESLDEMEWSIKYDHNYAPIKPMLTDVYSLSLSIHLYKERYPNDDSIDEIENCLTKANAYWEKMEKFREVKANAFKEWKASRLIKEENDSKRI